ncbi:TBC1 domain family member 19, partial [Galemys pyrenaicus]
RPVPAAWRGRNGEMLQEESDLSLIIAQIVQKLKGSNLYAQLERQAWTSLQRPEIKLESLKEDIKEFFKISGWEKKLQNAVYSELSVFPLPSHPAAPPEHLKEPLVYMRKAQVGYYSLLILFSHVKLCNSEQKIHIYVRNINYCVKHWIRTSKGSWEKRILKSLNSMCTELSIPLARKRPVGEQKELLNKWNEMGTDEPDLSLFRPVYAPKDFLEVLINLRNPNYENGDSLSFRTHLGLIQVPLKVKDIPELKEFFVELGLTTGQLGIDDSTQVPPELFENEHVRIGQKEQDSAAAQQYVRQGSPTALRAELWALILNISSQPEDILYYEQLKTNVIQHDLLVDSLIYKDVKLTASNDDYYFVFEDYLYQVLLCFSRDTSVLAHFAYNSASPPKSYIR